MAVGAGCIEQLDDEPAAVEHLTTEDLERIRTALGDQLSADCLAEEVRAFTRAGRVTEAFELLAGAYPTVTLRSNGPAESAGAACGGGACTGRRDRPLSHAELVGGGDASRYDSRPAA